MNEIKVGDRLAFHGAFDSWGIHEVTKITKSGRIVCGPHTLNPDLSVRGTGDSYHGPFRGEPVTQEIRDAIAIRNLRAVLREKLRRLRVDVLEIDELKQLKSVLDTLVPDNRQ